MAKKKDLTLKQDHNSFEDKKLEDFSYPVRNRRLHYRLYEPAHSFKESEGKYLADEKDPDFDDNSTSGTWNKKSPVLPLDIRNRPTLTELWKMVA